MSLLGAAAYRLAWCRSSSELLSYESARHMVTAAIVGVVYSQLHTNYNFPDSIMAFVAGWMGVDFLESIIDFLSSRRRKEEEEREE